MLVACAPTIDGPVEKQRAADTLDAARLTSQLSALPGVERAEVMLRRAVRDPLSTAAPAPSSISIVIVVDDKADRARIDASARALAKALVAVEPTIVVDVGAK